MTKAIVSGFEEKGLKTLRSESKPVTVFDKELNSLADNMLAAMHAAKGVGLSAVQIGVLKRIIVAEHSSKPAIEKFVLVNPEVTWESKKMVSDEEGCLSFPDLFGNVPRPEKIQYRGMDLQGKQVTGKAAGLLARVIQHEIDHLNGVLFMDRVEGDLYTYEKNKDKEAEEL